MTTEATETEIPEVIEDDEDRTTCDACDGLVPLEDAHIWVGNGTVCETCIDAAPRPGRRSERFIRCEDEGGYARSADCVTCNESGHYATRDYADENWLLDDAGDWYSRESYYYDAIEAREAEDEETSNVDIYGYHDTNPISTHGWPNETPRESLCYGVELEMEHASDDGTDGQSSLCNALGGRDGNGRYILMEDGSLNDSGVELITLPYTLKAHSAVFDWAATLAPVQRIGRSGKGTAACGMHIHVNRRAPVLTPLTIGKILVFINSPANDTLVSVVAQRNSTGFAKRYEKKVTAGRRPHEQQASRYEAINFTRETMEFRLFRGNLRADRVYKSLEFVEACIFFCRDAGLHGLDTPSFLAWVANRSSSYPNLYKFLVEKDHLVSANKRQPARDGDL